MRMVIEDCKTFLEGKEDQFYYVGFLKSPERWFPLCYASDPETSQHLDTLFLSTAHNMMHKVLSSYADQIPRIEQTFVQYLLPVEIQNLIERYGLKRIALITDDGEGSGGCSCGCGCV